MNYNYPMKYKDFLDDIKDLEGKRVIITGATSGIGFAFAKQCLYKKMKLTLLVRDLTNGEITLKRLRLDYPQGDIDLVEYNQASFSAIEAAIDAINKKYPDFDFLVCNAGVLKPTKCYRSEQNYPLTVGINYFGVIHLIEYLAKTNNYKHRVIVQGSIVAGNKLPKDLDVYSDKYNFFAQYNYSKALLESKIYSFVVNNTYPNLGFVITEPGISPTGITRNFPKIIRVCGKYFLSLFSLPESASRNMMLAISNQSENGDYIVPAHLFTLRGKPKKTKFPLKRYQEDKLI